MMSILQNNKLNDEELENISGGREVKKMEINGGKSFSANPYHFKCTTCGAMGTNHNTKSAAEKDAKLHESKHRGHVTVIETASHIC